MKKIMTAVAALAGAFTLVCAQDTSHESALQEALQAEQAGQLDRTVRVIIPENQHVTDKTASVRIEYEPMYDEARIYYTCMYVTYDKAEAMNTVIAILEDFMKENHYYHYQYMARDRERYFKNERGYNMAQYMSYVRFTR
ncbi:MAG: hypothetical protein IJ191_04250 [Treponema sp.]|nr:hypothetical protein [Treponema sp.]